MRRRRAGAIGQQGHRGDAAIKESIEEKAGEETTKENVEEKEMARDGYAAAVLPVPASRALSTRRRMTTQERACNTHSCHKHHPHHPHRPHTHNPHVHYPPVRTSAEHSD